MSERPLAVDLYCGLSGWGEGLAMEGFRVIGFDIVDMCAFCGVPRPEHNQLVLQDVLTLHGRQFKDVALITASPPCTDYSYRSFPWRRVRDLPPPDNSKFEACFRIQREASDAAGRQIPMIVENVRGAQKWVGQSRWAWGPFHLWADVPALMPFNDDVKQGGDWFRDMSGISAHSSKSPSRKQASAMIARIPLVLSRHIARTYYPR